MKCYHVTSERNAHSIQSNGFVDSTHTYLTSIEHSGVWISDRPLDINDMGGASDVCFEIDISENEIADFEWKEDPELQNFREWLVPSNILNLCPKRILKEQEVDDLTLPYVSKSQKT